MGVLANTQKHIKGTSAGLGLLLFRIFSAMVFGYTLSLIGNGLLIYGMFAFWLVFVSAFFVFIKITKKWGYLGVIVLDLILFLIGLLLRMYVLVAPGA